MACVSIKNKIISRSMLVGNTAFNPSSYESIATVTATGSESSLTFSSIPSTYTHLEIRGINRDSSGSGNRLQLRFNGDTGANYAWHWFYGNGAGTLSALGYTSQSSITVNNPSRDGDFNANTYAPFVLNIEDYLSTTKNKVVRSFSGVTNGNASYMIEVDFFTGAWYNTSAITSITCRADANFAAGSTFALYGIKGS